jgi:hypothetical protein
MRHIGLLVVGVALILMVSCISRDQVEEPHKVDDASISPSPTMTIPPDQTPVSSSPSTAKPEVDATPSTEPTATEVVVPTEAAVTEATATPEFMEEPDPSGTEVPLSWEYLNPEMAVNAITRELSGNPNESAWGITNERAYYLRAIYHLATADVGYFNADTTEFNSWLFDYLEEYRSNSPESIASRQARSEHLRLQIMAALNQPETEVSQRLRAIELSIDPLFFAPGPDAYWWFLFGPYGEASLDPLMLERMTIAFFRVVDEYEIASNLTGDAIDFSDLLHQSGFIDVWIDR